MRMLGTAILAAVLLAAGVRAEAVGADPEAMVPLPGRLEMAAPAVEVPAEMARFQGAWIGTWGDDIRTILIVEQVRPDGQADIVFAHGDSAWYGAYREWWRSRGTIAGGVLTVGGDQMRTEWLRVARYAFDGPDRLFMTTAYHGGGVLSGALARTDAARLAAGERPADWPRAGARVWIPHLVVRTLDGARPINLEGTFYAPGGPAPWPLAVLTHGSDAGRSQLRTIAFATEAHWLHEKGFAVLALMRRGRGMSEGVNGEEDFERAHDGSLVGVAKGVAEAVEDLNAAIAYGRTLPGVQAGKVLLGGQSRGGFLAMHYAGLKPGEVLGVLNFSGGWYPYGPVTTPYYAEAGRGAGDRVKQLWLYADNDRLYGKDLIGEYQRAFAAAGGSARFELLHGIPGNGHVLQLYPDRWRPIADAFLGSLGEPSR